MNFIPALPKNPNVKHLLFFCFLWTPWLIYALPLQIPPWKTQWLKWYVAFIFKPWTGDGQFLSSFSPLLWTPEIIVDKYKGEVKALLKYLKGYHTEKGFKYCLCLARGQSRGWRVHTLGRGFGLHVEQRIGPLGRLSRARYVLGMWEWAEEGIQSSHRLGNRKEIPSDPQILWFSICFPVPPTAFMPHGWSFLAQTWTEHLQVRHGLDGWDPQGSGTASVLRGLRCWWTFVGSFFPEKDQGHSIVVKIDFLVQILGPMTY